MSRKKRDAALSDIANYGAERWQFLKRNPKFLAEIDRLNAMPRGTRKQLFDLSKEMEQIISKWQLPYRLPLTYPINVDDNILMNLPVKVIKMTPPSLAEQLRAKRDGKAFTEDELRGRFVTLEVDTDYAIDDLIALVEGTIRDIYRAKHIPQHRRRLEKSEFQLQVYDEALAGKTFAKIAQAVRRPQSTVKSAYLVAIQKIFSDSEQPSKRKLPLTRLRAFTPVSHGNKCSECKKATRPEEMCKEAQLYIDQDNASLIGRTGGQFPV